MKVLLLNHNRRRDFHFNVGDRIAQIILEKVSMAKCIRVDELDATSRGDSGFGSSGLAALPVTVIDAPPFSTPTNWSCIDRLFIEFCTRADSSLGTPTSFTKGCFIIRITSEVDGTSPRTLSSLVAFLNSVPPRVKVLLWAGIPCTGGSPMQNRNAWRPGHKEKVAEHYRLMRHLLGGFTLLADVVIHRGGHLAFEWPEHNSYWQLPEVTSLFSLPLPWHEALVIGCAYGLTVSGGRNMGLVFPRSGRSVPL